MSRGAGVLAAMFLLPGGRADKYAYHADAADDAETSAQEGNVEKKISTFG